MPDSRTYHTEADTWIEGTIKNAYPCKDGRPFKMIIQTDVWDEQLSDFVALSFHAWPNGKDHEMAGELPKAVAKLNTQTDAIKGQSVKAHVRKLPDKGYGIQHELRDNDNNHRGYEVRVMYSYDNDQVVDGEGKAQPGKPSLPPTRMEIGMAKGNAISAITALISSYVSKTGKLPPLEFLEEGAMLINSGSEAILSGRMTEKEESSDDELVESFGTIENGMLSGDAP